MAAIGHEQMKNYPFARWQQPSLRPPSTFLTNGTVTDTRVTDNIVMTEWMHSDGLGRLATASERIRLVILNG